MTADTEPSMFEGLDFDFGGRLAVIKAIANSLPTPGQGGDPMQEMAELVVANSGMKILNRELTYLADDMEVDLRDDSPAERLAEVISIFEGNRRKARPT